MTGGGGGGRRFLTVQYGSKGTAKNQAELQWGWLLTCVHSVGKERGGCVCA